MLARGELQTIGATTLEEFRKHFEKDAALERRFQSVQVDEPKLSDAIEILDGLKDRYEVPPLCFLCIYSYSADFSIVSL